MLDRAGGSVITLAKFQGDSQRSGSFDLFRSDAWVIWRNADELADATSLGAQVFQRKRPANRQNVIKYHRLNIPPDP
jgi:hypothetical protein